MTAEASGAPKNSRLSYREFKGIAHKGSDEIYYLDKYVFRHISIVGSYLLSFTRISPNAVTLVSFIFAVSAAWFFMRTESLFLLLGCAAVFIYHYLDHVDGELARVYAATRGYKSGIGGAYLDILVHSFTVNIWLPALAFGIYLETEQPLVMLLGVLAMPALSNFAQYIGAYMFTTRLVADPAVASSEEGRAALEELTGRHRQAQAVQAGAFSKRGLIKITKEIIGYPGMIFLVIVGVIVDVALGSIWGRLGVLVLLTLFHAANTARRTAKISRRFKSIQ